MSKNVPKAAWDARKQNGVRTEGRIMSTLRHGREMSPAEISEKTGFTRSRVNHAIERLVKKGQIVKITNPHIKVKAQPPWKLVEAVLPDDEFKKLKDSFTQ